MVSFSPEWVALTWAAHNGVPAEPIDVPAAVMVAWWSDEGFGERRPLASADPIGAPATAVGYDDPEAWREDIVEHRGFGPAADGVTGGGPSEAITEAMAAKRCRRRPVRRRCAPTTSQAERRSRRVAVVFGAWHAPVLVDRTSVASDRAVRSGLRNEKMAVTWMPSTDGRLALASGYGAGMASPGWYGHLSSVPDQPVARWMAKVAAALRAEGLSASPASVVEAVRLANGLAVLRGQPLPGLGECTDAIRAVLTGGPESPLRLIWRGLVVGGDVGEVPDEVPTIPLAADLAATSGG